MQYKVLKDFKGSPDGRFSVQYKKGETVELTTSLAEVAVAEKWVKKVREPKQAAEEEEEPPAAIAQVATEAQEKPARKTLIGRLLAVLKTSYPT